MAANSFYSRFKELYEEQQRLDDDLLVLTKEVRESGEDVISMKKIAKLAVRDKLKAEAAKYRRLRKMAEENEQPGLFD